MMLRKVVLSIICLVWVVAASAESKRVLGTIKDKKTKEPLVGAMVVIENTSEGTIAGVEGEFELKLTIGVHRLTISNLSYVTKTVEVVVSNEDTPILIELEPDAIEMDQVVVVGQKNLETEVALLRERGLSSVSIESMGVKEMSMKGISNVQEGVKKLTGISVASAGQIIVRGLGDRYSITTLNGLPIASLNPDNKLIPLDVFPSSTVKNVTVSKVYSVTSFADYSGAHIDISTKEQGGDRLLTLGVSTGGVLNTVGKNFYQMDNVSMFTKSQLYPQAIGGTYSEFKEYIKSNSVFDTSFDVTKTIALPDLSGNIAYGDRFEIGNQRLDVLLTASLNSGSETTLSKEERKLNSQGDVTDEYNSNEYETSLNAAALASVGVTLRDNDYLGYNLFFARNASNTYQERRGFSYENDDLLGLNSQSRIYSLINQQLTGRHQLNNRISMNWAASYGATSSEEPDRREVLYIDNQTTTRFFNTNDPTQRFFGSLEENELDGLLDVSYTLKNDSKIKAGFAVKDKTRDYSSNTFYYDLKSIQNDVNDYYTPSEYINESNFSDATITINREMKNRNQYSAEAMVMAGYLMTDWNLTQDMLVNLGVRFENSMMAVDYHDYSDMEQRSELNTIDFFPALNMKYCLSDENQVRFSASRTVTRPSFIEMAPFEYQESYGSGKIIGNVDLANGYNYNIDVRFESLSNNGNLFSVTGYYKILDNPIERVQRKQGEDDVVHTFNNADRGSAMGFEIEYRKQFFNNLTLSLNGSYMYTDVNLSDSGGTIYTNKNRALQGASPYLFNADVTYGFRFNNNNQLHLALLYNLQGPRIHAVGLDGFGDIMQRTVHALNVVATYKLTNGFDVKFEVNNLANQDMIFDQELPSGGEPIIVEKYRPGISTSVGLSFKF